MDNNDKIASECLDEIIVWLKERGLYSNADYQDEGADFCAILSEHEGEIIAQGERKQLKQIAKVLEQALEIALKYTEHSYERRKITEGIRNLINQMTAPKE